MENVMDDLEYANARIDELEEAIATAQRKFERGEDRRDILVELFADAGFEERKDVSVTPPLGQMAAKPGSADG